MSIISFLSCDLLVPSCLHSTIRKLFDLQFNHTELDLPQVQLHSMWLSAFYLVSKSFSVAFVAGVMVTLRGTAAQPFNVITTFTLIGSAWLQLSELARPENGQKITLPPPCRHCCWGLIQPPFRPLAHYVGTADGWMDVLLTSFWKGGWNHKWEILVALIQ